MPPDPLCGLLKRNQIIDLPGGQEEVAARQLARLGLLSLQEYEYVRCVNSLDPDQRYLKDSSCVGRIIISANKDPDNHDYQCPDCNRVVFPDRKQKAKALKLIPDAAQVHALVRREVESLGREVREHPNGLLRVEVESGDVQVCIVDACFDRAVFQRGYPQSAPILYVIGNDRDYRHRVPEGGEIYRVVELALDRTRQAFRRRLRQLARLDSGNQLGPAVLGLPAPMPSPEAPPGPTSAQQRLTCPPGTRWSEIEMFLVDGTTIAIRIAGKRMRRFTHQDLGLAHSRSSGPKRAWIVLAEVCEQNGTRQWRDEPEKFNAFKEVASQLGLHLQDIFGIREKSFKGCSKKDGLRAAFTARDRLPDEEADIHDCEDSAEW